MGGVNHQTIDAHKGAPSDGQLALACTTSQWANAPWCAKLLVPRARSTAHISRARVHSAVAASGAPTTGAPGGPVAKAAARAASCADVACASAARDASKLAGTVNVHLAYGQQVFAGGIQSKRYGKHDAL